MAMNGSHEFNALSMENMLLNDEVEVADKIWNVGFEDERGLFGQEKFLARGLGIDGGSRGGVSGGSGGDGGSEFNPAGSSGDGGDNHEVEEYYKRMVDENPCNPLFLGNYAQFLYQSKRDLVGAEEYYSRGILADPKDGETLSQYANHVQAAYASFLWETEEDADECAAPSYIDSMPTQFHEGTLASA
ncbi:hypothetical protein CRYUN_Cryun01aG0154600 [Craigia yunnanensis]